MKVVDQTLLLDLLPAVLTKQLLFLKIKTLVDHAILHADLKNTIIQRHLLVLDAVNVEQLNLPHKPPKLLKLNQQILVAIQTVQQHQVAVLKNNQIMNLRVALMTKLHQVLVQAAVVIVMKKNLLPCPL